MSQKAVSAKPAPYRGIGSEIVRAVSRAWLAAFGWKMAGDWPDFPKAIIVAAPHTSNWDGLHMVAAAGYYRVKLRWMGKASLARGLKGPLFRRAGLVPVSRSGGNDIVAQAAEAIRAADSLILAVAPEGTRAYTATWKTGFYQIAKAAGVPILMARLDYGTRTITVSGPVHVTGDMEADLTAVKAAYAGVQGLRPEHWEPVA